MPLEICLRWRRIVGENVWTVAWVVGADSAAAMPGWPVVVDGSAVSVVDDDDGPPAAVSLVAVEGLIGGIAIWCKVCVEELRIGCLFSLKAVVVGLISFDKAGAEQCCQIRETFPVLLPDWERGA